MIKQIMKKFGLSQQGAKNYIYASSYEALNNLMNLLPMMLFIYFLYDIEKYWAQEQNGLTPWYVYLILSLAIIVILYVTSYLNYTTLFVSTYKESEKSRKSLAEKLKNLPMSYYSKKKSSEISNVLLNDVADMEMYLSGALPKMTGLVPIFVLLFIGLMIIDIKVTILGVIVIPISIIIYKITKRKEKESHEKYFEFLNEQSGEFQEQIELIRETRILNKKQEVLKELTKLLKKQEKTHMDTELSVAITQGFINVLLNSGMGIVIIASVYQYVSNQINIIELMILLLAFSKLYALVIQTYEMMNITRYVQARINRINSLYEEEEQKGSLKPKFKNFNFEIKDLKFSYNQYTVIDDISFEAKENEITAIVGPSGSGKSTILRLLSRLYDYKEGEIKLGGVDITKIDVNYLFEHLSVVFQDVTLFNTSILENIRIGNKHATDEMVIQAAKNARCDEFINQFSNGYHTIIGENGSKLSGGERQRISIARAFLKNSPILFLDETSSALDSINEYEVQQALSRLVENKTVIVIAHRLKTIENANKIIVLEKGKIKEQGTAKELLQNENGLFTKMYSIENKLNEEYEG
ncbi:hypothetical protein L1F34_000271 [Mammaliicoccus lentus]|uniref:ABC transporter ATP-binding protein n=1 Tax=Mammaliicoccus lentus TaxID=42858 RepID=UPI0039EB05EB